MKRDEIKTLIPEITDEQLNEVMRINGEDINKAKGDTKKLEGDLETARNDLKTAQDTIKTLEENKGDLEKVQKELDTYKDAEKKRKEAEDVAAAHKAISDRFDGCVGDKKFINDFTREGVLNEFKAALEAEENKGKGDSEIYEALTKDREGIFSSPNTISNMSGMGGDVHMTDDNAARAVMGLPPLNNK